MKKHRPATTHKKVVVARRDTSTVKGYINPAGLGKLDTLDLLTPEGEHEAIPLTDVRCIHFVREFADNFEAERKSFFSRPKLEGLWVKLKFFDQETLEGIVVNDLLDLLENGIQITPPDLHGNSLRIFVPRTSLVEIKVLGVVGIARRPAAKPSGLSQPKLFSE